MCLSFSPAIPLLEIYPEDILPTIQKNTYINVYTYTQGYSLQYYVYFSKEEWRNKNNRMKNNQGRWQEYTKNNNKII